MGRRITIDPATRLEGHGRIDIFLDDDGAVAECFFRVPELRGFESFARGRPIEEMPRITSRICGVCPEAHLMASAKAGDAAYGLTIPRTAALLRELQYCAFVVADHATHLFALGGPDLLLGPDTPVAERNLLGVLGKLGREAGREVVRARLACHEVSRILGGRTLHAVNALPGGVSKGLDDAGHERVRAIAGQVRGFAEKTLAIFERHVLGDDRFLDLLRGEPHQLRVHNMGLVDARDRVTFYDGTVRVVDTEGAEVARYPGAEYRDHVAEHVEPWTYAKFPYLKAFGWQGFVDGPRSGVYRASPLARLNVSSGMATPLAHEQYERWVAELGPKPVHATFATHWARLIELVYAAERLGELARHPEIRGPEIHVAPTRTPSEGVGVVEAPRGTLTHHYVTDADGIVQRANLIVGTTNNHAAICLSVKRAAAAVIRPGHEPTEAVLNHVEMAFRAYDPCYACATHFLPGEMPLEVRILDPGGDVRQTFRRG